MAGVHILSELTSQWASRRPVVGVIVGLVGVAMSMVIATQAMRDVRRTHGLVLMEERVKDLVSEAVSEPRYVRLLDGHPRWDLADVKENDRPWRWIAGRYERALVPVEDDAGRVIVLASFTGRADASDIGPLIGMLSAAGATNALGSLPRVHFVGEPAVLAVGKSPRSPWWEVAMSTPMLLVSTWLVVHFARRRRSTR